MKEEYRAIVTKIEYQTPNGYYDVSSQQGSFEERVPVDLDHHFPEHCSHNHLIERREDAVQTFYTDSFPILWVTLTLIVDQRSLNEVWAIQRLRKRASPPVS